MPGSQATATDPTRQASFRWSRGEIIDALDRFAQGDLPSQRQAADEIGVPHATFDYWVRHYSAAIDDPVDAFFCSSPGESVLRHIVLAALCTFSLQGACGIRLIGSFLQRAGLDRFVGASRGALHPLLVHLESDLVAFRDWVQPALAQQMKARTITLVPDEHFHAGNPCLVGLEPVSNFIVVECYREHRDADTWEDAIKQGICGMHVEVVCLTSDLASALVCCAEKVLEVAHCPDLFHGQRDLLKPLLLPLQRPIQQGEKDLQKVEQISNRLDGPLHEPQSEKDFLALIEAVCQAKRISAELKQARGLKEEAVQQVRGIGDDYHPFDRKTGLPVEAEEVGKQLNTHLDRLEKVVQEAGLGERARQAVNKSRTWAAVLMGCVAWFWGLAKTRVQELGLSEEQEKVVCEKLLPGYYWAMAAPRARTAEERSRLKEMAEELKKQAWAKGTALAELSDEERKRVEEVAVETAGLFQRSSSCVEGRNGRLSLQHHGHSRVSERRLKALTVIHNYVIERPDGTTAAQRFFGQKHEDVFAWLLRRMPDLPRPAKKRSRSAA